MWMVYACAKEYGPAIIYIDGIDVAFPKKGSRLSK